MPTKPTPLAALHALRAEELMRWSPRMTHALAIMERAAPAPVRSPTLTAAFACAASETAHVLARMARLGLVERDADTLGWRLAPEALALSQRVQDTMRGAITSNPENDQ